MVLFESRPLPRPLFHEAVLDEAVALASMDTVAELVERRCRESKPVGGETEDWNLKQQEQEERRLASGYDRHLVHRRNWHDFEVLKWICPVLGESGAKPKQHQ